jgi:signal peptidase I
MCSILKHKIESAASCQITVGGNSMLPVLHNGDVITIRKEDKYEIGDVLIFKYGEEGILVHRLLKTKDKKYYCKGDNCYRLEEIDKTDIFGKVIGLPDVDIDFINLSLAVNTEFAKNYNDFYKTIATDVYKKYKSRYLEEKNNNEV